jgi:hypothetical protein
VDFWPQLRAPLLGRRDAAGVALRPPGPKVPGRVSKRAGPCIHQASARRKPPAYSPFDPNGAKLRAVIFDFLRGRRPFHV